MSIAEANQTILEIKLDSKQSFIEKLKALAPLLIMTGFLTDEPVCDSGSACHVLPACRRG